MKMYLDDIRNPKGNFDIIVRSVAQAIETVNLFGVPSYISFDHDLGDNVLSGYDFATYLIEIDISSGGSFIPKDFAWNVHSANPIGRDNINGLLNSYMRFRQ